VPPDPRESTGRFRLLGLATHLAISMIACLSPLGAFLLSRMLLVEERAVADMLAALLVGALWFAGNNANGFLFSTWTSLLELSW